MDRNTLSQVLTHASGITASADEGTFEVAESHRVTFYIGEPGQAMQISEASGCTLHEGFIEVRTCAGSSVYVADDSVHAVSVRPPKGEDRRRAGFS